MIYIIGIVGSPRVEGNTEKLVVEALKAASDEEEGVQNGTHKIGWQGN